MGPLRRGLLLAVTAGLVLAAAPLPPTPGLGDRPVDCVGPVEEPEPGTPEYRQLMVENASCAEQRHQDKLEHPTNLLPADELGADAYREPSLHDGTRFRFDTTTIAGMEAEVYRPCTEQACQDMPADLQPHAPPYPAIVIYHGGASRKELHWWSSQVLAEAGYMVVVTDSSGLSHSREEAEDVLSWLHDPANELASDYDGETLGVAGHSAGGVMVSRLGQEDPRVDAVVSWDRAQSTSQPEDVPWHAPALYFTADYNCQQVPVCQPDPPRDSPPEDRTGPGDKGRDFERARAGGVDTMQIGLRAALHLDWVPSDLSGNRWAEPVTMYYTLAWFDRYLRGTHDEAMATNAFRRLTATAFDDSFDVHALSQGRYDPVAAATAADPLAGNQPHQLEGLPTTDRLSFLYLSRCAITAPGGDGDLVVSEDMRTDPCGDPDDAPTAPAAAGARDVLGCTGPAPEAEPGTPAFAQRDLHNVLCAEQRLVDAAQHPALARPTDMPVSDPYREPAVVDRVRVRHHADTVTNRKGQELAVEIHRPCALGICPDLPDGLVAHEPPYPVVLVLHGGYQSRKELHRWATQSLAEAGYITVSLDAVHDDEEFFEDATDVFDWFMATPDAPNANGRFNPFHTEVDRDRIGVAGHSGGGATANRLGTEDNRFDAVVAWDRSGRYDLPETITVPSMFHLADHGFTPERREEQPDPDGYDDSQPHDPGDKWQDHDQAVADGVDTMKIALRAATHLDWVPQVSAASRHGEAVSAYYTLAWFDRYVAGQSDPALAVDAFRRLTATTFDDSYDVHNISQGVYDPATAAIALDPKAGNQPYLLEGMPVSDRLSFYFHSKCSITEPGQTKPTRYVSEDLRRAPCTAEQRP